MNKYVYIISLTLLTFSSVQSSTELNNDPHYSELGFFDIHICNWPDWTIFFKILFSSEKFSEIESMDVYTPQNTLLTQLDKSKFRILKRKNKPDKHVYISDVNVPANATTGWYTITVKTHNGKKYYAKDYIVMNGINRISEMQPANNETIKHIFPVTLKWKPVTGARYYQVYVRDEWTQNSVFESKLLTNTEITIPNNKLETGGYYSWRVHARDTNEHVLLGDFNMGSMSKHAFFTIAE